MEEYSQKKNYYNLWLLIFIIAALIISRGNIFNIDGKISEESAPEQIVSNEIKKQEEFAPEPSNVPTLE